MIASPMILCCGEALIDMLPRTTDAGEPAFAPYPGGAVFNTAIALGRLGVRTEFYCPIADDLFGQQLRSALAESGVDHSLSPSIDRPCTLAFVSLQSGQARYAFYDRATALRDLTPADLPLALPDAASTLFFGGISLVGEPCGAAFEALCLREAPDRVIMLDPNIRPSFIRDEAAYRARLAAMIAVADIIKLSDDDLHWLMGRGDLATLASALRAQGPSVVVITQGADGAIGIGPAGQGFVPARAVDVVDTVGAGDTFNAGFLASIARAGLLHKDALCTLSRSALHDALDLGIRAASITVARAGANPPRNDELPD